MGNAGRITLVIFFWGATALSAFGLVRSVIDNNLTGVLFSGVMVVLWGYIARELTRRL